MRLEELHTEPRGDAVERSIRVSWIGGQARLRTVVPGAYAPDSDDASPFVPVALMLAMRRGEPLQIDAAVAPRLLRSLPQAQEILSQWSPHLERVPVRVSRTAAPAPPAGGRASCFSRGVDSTYSAAVERPSAERLSHLLFCDALEPGYSPGTMREEIELARGIAKRLGLELVLVSTNLFELTSEVIDYEDIFGAVLAMLGLSVAGGIGRLTIPSSTSYAELLPVGSHPLLDQLWSTEWLDVTHDSCIPGRDAKLRWLAERRPELLDSLHVCWVEDSTRNCGRCGKCLWTMVFLHAAGALDRTSAFPDRIDLADLRRVRRPSLIMRLGWNTAYRALSDAPEDEELKEAIAELLRESAAMDDGGVSLSISSHQTRLYRSLDAGRPADAALRRGVEPTVEVGALDPTLPPPRGLPDGLVGLVCALDHDSRRHRYAAGGLPQGERLGELGALLAEPPHDTGVPLRLTAEGTPLLKLPRRARPRPLAALRWMLEPLTWIGAAPTTRRLRSVARRAWDVARAARPGRDQPRGGEASVCGWLRSRPRNGSLPLWASAHPVLEDTLLTTEQGEPATLGYEQPVLLGYLEPHAPVTASLGTRPQTIPWARWAGRGRGTARRRRP